MMDKKQPVRGYAASLLLAGLLPIAMDSMPGVQKLKEKYEPKPCFNKCGEDRTPGKLFCSAECCREFKSKGKK